MCWCFWDVLVWHSLYLKLLFQKLHVIHLNLTFTHFILQSELFSGHSSLASHHRTATRLTYFLFCILHPFSSSSSSSSHFFFMRNTIDKLKLLWVCNWCCFCSDIFNTQWLISAPRCLPSKWDVGHFFTDTSKVPYSNIF